MTFFTTLLAQGQQQAEEVFGKVTPPDGVAGYTYQSGGTIGIIAFASSLIRLFTIVAGIYVMVNFLLAGWTYITSSGDPGAHKKVADRLTHSIMGLALIVGAYTLAGLIGLIFFGDAGFILNPALQGPGEVIVGSGAGGG